jgi:hypothetical protein
MLTFFKTPASRTYTLQQAELIVIKEFHPKKGLEKGLRKC